MQTVTDLLKLYPYVWYWLSHKVFRKLPLRKPLAYWPQVCFRKIDHKAFSQILRKRSRKKKEKSGTLSRKGGWVSLQRCKKKVTWVTTSVLIFPAVLFFWVCVHFFAQFCHFFVIIANLCWFLCMFSRFFGAGFSNSKLCQCYFFKLFATLASGSLPVPLFFLFLKINQTVIYVCIYSFLIS